MEVKKGYKQTEIGMIPSDWEVKRLGELGRFSKGQGIKKDEAQSGDIPCIRYGEIYTKHDNVIKEFYSFISPSVAKTAKKIRQGDILFAGSGETKEEIGKCVANTISAEAYAGGDIVILSPLNADPLLLGYLLNSPPIAKQKSSKGQGDAVVHISAKGLKGVVVSLPKTKSEQSAIAAVISETDSLITNLEKLIAKKEAIKKGTLEALLTGKKRLPGFSEKWKYKTLGEIGECIIGLTYTPSNVSESGLLVLRSSNIKNNSISFDDSVYVSIDVPEKLITIKGDLLICVRNGSRNLIGKCAIIDTQAANQTFGAFMSVFRSVYNDFIFHVFQSNIIKKQIDENIGATINQITNKNLNSFKIPFPDKEEQSAITEVLNDLSKETAQLEEKLAKCKQLKTGLMSQLLTGKIRLL
ncbi:MAG: restriction endonuclease subunit S [Chitinophagaceae bacterium]|nr:MAG: restriction endonuclease subunit S [Chitinophagaceae bacterium]